MSDQGQYLCYIAFHQKQKRIGTCIERVCNLKVFTIRVNQKPAFTVSQFGVVR